MRILLIHQYFLEKEDAGGSRFNEMSRIWGEKDIKLTVLAGMVHYATGKKPDKYKRKLVFKDNDFYKNVNVIRTHVSKTYNKSFLGRLWAYFSFVFSSIFAGLFVAREKYDIILATSPSLFVGITARTLSIFKKIPFVFEIRDLWPESAIDTGILKNKNIIKFAYWYEKRIYKQAKLINVLTPAFREKLIHEKKVPTNKIFFIPNAADFTLAESLKNFDGLDYKKKLGLDKKFVITYVGAHGVANHLIQLIDVAEKITDTNVVFQLIGDGMEKEKLIKEANKRNLENVIFRDPVSKENVFKYILASDLGTSVLKKVDTFKTIYSNKTFDYMSCKKPVLLLIDGVSRELIRDADCGWYAEPENINEIEKTIREIIHSKDILRKGENGFNFAKKNFDRVALSQKYLKILEKAATIS